MCTVFGVWYVYCVLYILVNVVWFCLYERVFTSLCEFLFVSASMYVYVYVCVHVCCERCLLCLHYVRCVYYKCCVCYERV